MNNPWRTVTVLVTTLVMAFLTCSLFVSLRENLLLSIIISFAVASTAAYADYWWQQKKREEEERQRQLEEEERAERREREEAEDRWPRVPEVQKEPEAPKPPKPAPLYLQDLTLLIQDLKPDRLRLGHMVDVRSVETIRPVAVIIARSPNFVGKKLPLSFNLLGPRGGLRYECRMLPVLKPGENHIVADKGFPVTDDMSKGSWKIGLWLGNHPWGEASFAVSRNSVEEIAKEVIGDDMELNPTALGKIKEVELNYDELLE